MTVHDVARNVGRDFNAMRPRVDTTGGGSIRRGRSDANSSENFCRSPQTGPCETGNEGCRWRRAGCTRLRER
jgi:hypothetical protein